MSTDIQKQLLQYIENNKQLGSLRNQVKALKKETQEL